MESVYPSSSSILELLLLFPSGHVIQDNSVRFVSKHNLVSDYIDTFKICIIEVYLLKPYIYLIIYKWRCYRQTIYIMVPYVDIIGLCHSVAILW